MLNIEMLKRWQFRHLPFVNRPIREDLDCLFADRETKLREIAFAEGHGLVYLYGVQGIGKTSLFHKYRYSVNRRKKEKTDFLYTEIVPQKDRIMIQILRTVLVVIREDIFHVNNKSKLEVEPKLESMDRIKTTTNALLGKVGAGELVKILVNLGAETSKQTSVAFNPITDANAAEELVPFTLCTVLNNFNSLKSFIRWYEGKGLSDLSQITLNHLHQYQDWINWIQNGYKAKKQQPSSIRKTLLDIRQFFYLVRSKPPDL